jgi:hypothetical protein
MEELLETVVRAEKWEVRRSEDFFLIGVLGGGVQLGSLGNAATNSQLCQPRDYEGEEIGGMIGRGNRSSRRKPASLPLCPPQTPHAAWTRTRAAAVGSQRLTAWAAALPSEDLVELWDIRQTVKAEDSFKIRYQETASEDWGGFMCAVVRVMFWVCNSVRLV